MYTNDYGGYCPTSSLWSAMLPEDWIQYQSNRNIYQSVIVPYVGNFNPSLFLCPADDPNLSSNSSINSPIIKSGDVVDASEKMLLVCEDACSLDDGNWSAAYENTSRENLLAIRHDRPLPPNIPDLPSSGDPELVDNAWRGNVACVDGHVEFVNRGWTRTQLRWDPTMKP